MSNAHPTDPQDWQCLNRFGDCDISVSASLARISGDREHELSQSAKRSHSAHFQVRLVTKAIAPSSNSVIATLPRTLYPFYRLSQLSGRLSIVRSRCWKAGILP
ncbi:MULTISPECIES: hypothetical protein [Limnospira]|uniref:Uncharacterized protein n=1 Tax=Limnospira fusiformis PMC 851.14 TaxID=2219512 RepID=A0ABU9EP32_LIMFS|nr:MULTISPECIES: hypothetical protein [Limnospira]EKD10888.1 8-oxoguanine DNA glycosylase [Arthrospira platensis C1]QJB24425.1 hypothetical protein HFV01_21890 [Limnospira fusiformis SAG 85.79]QNH58713.1 MAG: hypothetical protein H2674_05215 [Limnospira indica BM01]